MFEKFERGTEVLMTEHRAIERVLEVLERMMAKYEAEDQLDIKTISDIVDFLRTFADGYHHAKEEKLLFPTLNAKGMSFESGPVAVMLHEHDNGRRYIRGLSGGIEKYQSDPAKAKKEIIENARGYIDLLKQHIFKEDNILFPMADSLINEQEQKKLLADFERTEKKEIGEGVYEKYHKLIEELEKRFS